MDDVERGMDDVERGIDDVGQARFVPQENSSRRRWMASKVG
jgi:hypothetical protein